MATSPSSPTSPSFARRRASSVAHSVSSATQGVVHAGGDILNQHAPLSFWSAAGVAASQAPTILEIRRGSFGPDGWQSRQGQDESERGRRRSTNVQDSSKNAGLESFVLLTEAITNEETETPSAHAIAIEKPIPTSATDIKQHNPPLQPIQLDSTSPPSQPIPRPTSTTTTTTTTTIFHTYLKWTFTPLGIFLTLYALNIVAWGGMLFLLLCNASPAMCWGPIPSPQSTIHRSPASALSWLSTQSRVFDCGSINSPRRIWIEIDSQILNALFCVTGFGLVPWRGRDLYYLLRFRFGSAKRRSGLEGKMYGLRVLAGIHRSWFRLPGSETLGPLSLGEYEVSLDPTITGGWSLSEDVRVPLPLSPDVGNTFKGEHAPATAVWKMDFFVWCNVGNTLFQVALCFFMWRFDRYTRPSWATGLFIALACIVAGAGGIVSFVEGKKVKKVEGVVKANDKAVDRSNDRARDLYGSDAV